MKTSLVKVRMSTEISADFVCHVENGKVVKIFAHGKELQIAGSRVFYRNEWRSYWLPPADDKENPVIDLPTIK